VHVTYAPPDQFGEAISFQLLGPLIEARMVRNTTGNVVEEDAVAVLGEFHGRAGFHNDTHHYHETVVAYSFPDEANNPVFDIWLCNVAPGLYLFEVSDYHPYQEECITQTYPGISMGSYEVSLSYVNSSAMEVVARGEGGVDGLAEGVMCYEDSLFFICPDETNNCESSPCQNSGVCSEACREYTCVCADGFEGPNCEFVAVDECDQAPCQHGGTCIDLYQARTCSCAAGYGGDDCGQRVLTVFDPRSETCEFAWLELTVRPNR
jgi:hypothetical protein